MARIHKSWWMNEKDQGFVELSPGYHYKKAANTLVVPPGEVVTIYKNQDRQGDKTYPLYEGKYNHLVYYGMPTKPGVIHVDTTGVTDLDLVKIGWTSKDGNRYPVWYALPIGDWRFGRDFPNDRIEWIEIPFGVTVEVFEDGNTDGGSLIFSGNDEGKTTKIDLKDFGYSRKASFVQVRADEWVSAGIAIEDETITSDTENRVVATTELANNSPHTAEVSKEISAEISDTMEENWGIEAGVTASVGFEAGPEYAKVTGEIEVSFSGNYGESKSTTKTRTITDTASVEIEGYGRAKASMIVEVGRIEGIAVRKWRNKRTNAIIEQRGAFSCERGGKATIEVS